MLRSASDVPKSRVVKSWDDALETMALIGLPLHHPARRSTMGGLGGGIAYNKQDYRTIVEHGLEMSPVHEVLVEESVLGWKEYELEVMRDHADNCVVVCSIENIDPMGVHTGDSITVRPRSR